MLQEFSEKHKLPKYRIDQFNHAFYVEAVESFDDIKTWPKDLRNELSSELEFSSLELVSERTSARGDTTKAVFKVKRFKKYIETVLMKHKDGRNTICISCMVGCPVNCSFCATGKLGFGGNLSDTEIIDQILHFKRILAKSEEKVTNIVFMGMGEPMLNFDNVVRAIAIMTDEKKLALSNRRLTLSTSGFVDKLDKLVKSGFKGRLAISLHAPNQELREKIMPVAKQFSLKTIMKSIDEYTNVTNKRVSYEYVLIHDVNDTPDNARELVELMSHRLHHLNLIPYNKINGVNFKRSSEENIQRFTKILDRHNLNYTLRVTMGHDVDAACGQLASKYTQN